jgi:hypothetical protein
MNILKLSALSLCLGSFLFAGCNKDNSVISSKVTATIGGSSWTSIAAAKKTSTSFIISGTQLSSSLVTSELVITIKGLTTGTYKLSVLPVSTECLATYTPNILKPLVTYASTTGTVTLSEIDTDNQTISGSFNFTCANTSVETLSVESGKFTDVKYVDSSK